jgi:hypothetical protein
MWWWVEVVELKVGINHSKQIENCSFSSGVVIERKNDTKVVIKFHFDQFV